MKHFAALNPVFPLALLLAGTAPAAATDGGPGIPIRTTLLGFEEVPSVFSEGSGTFLGLIDGSVIEFTLSYEGLANVTQAHIHFGQHHTNGGIVVFLCTNLAPPAGVPVPDPCPPAAGKVAGVLTADDVLAVAAQGIDAGNLGQLIEAILAGAAYVNVHTEAHPAGAIRGQISVGRGFAAH
jgi:hypothetical protein